MLAIRMQRTGRKGNAQFRIIVQESRRTPTSGNIVSALGSYDPHTKTVILNKEDATKYLNNGAHPSPRVAMLLQKEGITLPSWVKVDNAKTKNIKNLEKLRRNAPKEEAAAEEPVAVEETTADAPAEEAAAETVQESDATEA